MSENKYMSVWGLLLFLFICRVNGNLLLQTDQSRSTNIDDGMRSLVSVTASRNDEADQNSIFHVIQDPYIVSLSWNHSELKELSLQMKLTHNRTAVEETSFLLIHATTFLHDDAEYGSSRNIRLNLDDTNTDVETIVMISEYGTAENSAILLTAQLFVDEEHSQFLAFERKSGYDEKRKQLKPKSSIARALGLRQRQTCPRLRPLSECPGFDKLPGCPSTLAQARNDSRFVDDSACTFPCGIENADAPNFRENCLCNIFHNGAAGCIRGTSEDAQGTGQQCCYDSDENLITDPYKGAGTFDCVAPQEGDTRIAVIQHNRLDVIPYFLCCNWLIDQGRRSGACDEYYRERPSNDGSDYVPP